MLGSLHIYNTDLSFGSTGLDVEALQMFLIGKSTGPAAQALAVRGVTGIFGALTQAALAEYQNSAGISPANGVFDAATRAVLNAMHAGF